MSKKTLEDIIKGIGAGMVTGYVSVIVIMSLFG